VCVYVCVCVEECAYYLILFYEYGEVCTHVEYIILILFLRPIELNLAMSLEELIVGLPLEV
jgi:hypothetical protein